jgi:tetratricopeptide (TPR) repeat protein
VQFYRSGREHFEAGRYREAIADLEQALALDPSSPTLVYNVARVYELLGELDEAIRYYQVYLQMLTPDEEDERSRVVETIERLEGARGQVGATTDVQPPDNPHLDRPVIVEKHGVADAAFWGTAIGAAVLLAGGGILGAVALVMKGNAECVVGDVCTLQERDDYAATSSSLALGADILLVTGGVAAITAMLLYVIRTREVETYPQYQGTTAFFGTDGNSALVGLRGAF